MDYMDALGICTCGQQLWAGTIHQCEAKEMTGHTPWSEIKHKWIENAKQYVSECKFPEYAFEVDTDSRGSVYLRAFYAEEDTTTGLNAIQYTRKWFISPEMSKSEVVATAFKCVMTSMEHRTREWFTYKNRAIYMPHYNVDELHKICEEREVRPTSFGEIPPDTYGSMERSTK